MKTIITKEQETLIRQKLSQQVLDESVDFSKFYNIINDDTIRLQIVINQDFSIADLEAFIRLNNQ